MDEALSYLFEGEFAWVFALFQDFDVLTGRDLSLGFNPLARLVVSHFVTVCKRIIFASFPYEVFVLFALGDQKHLFHLEVFEFYVLWDVYFEVALDCKEELFVKRGWSWQTDVLADCFDASVNFLPKINFFVADD